MILGTVAYLSPEQVTTGAADARSDVYAAGVLLYELLTGAPPVHRRHRDLGRLPARPRRRAGAVVAAAGTCRPSSTTWSCGPPAATRPPAPPTPPRSSPRCAGSPSGPGSRGCRRRCPRPLREPEALRGPTAATPQRLPGVPGPRGTRALPRDDAGVGGPCAGYPPAPGPAGRSWRGSARSRRVFGTWISVVAVLGLLVGAAGWWLGDGRWTDDADRRRASSGRRAERLLLAADLVATVTVARDDDVAAGLVSAVDPGSGCTAAARQRGAADGVERPSRRCPRSPRAPRSRPPSRRSATPGSRPPGRPPRGSTARRSRPAR